MSIGEFINGMRARGERAALAGSAVCMTYRRLVEEIGFRRALMEAYGVRAGEVVAVEGDFTTGGLATALAVSDLGGVVVPLRPRARAAMTTALEVCHVQHHLKATAEGVERVATRQARSHPLLSSLKGQAGLILLTSGTTETPRAVLHDFDRFVGSLIGPGRAQRTLAFLRFDHIGGLNTAFRCLATGGTLVTIDRHSPEAVCEAIQRYAVEALPTTPSFLRSLLWSDVLDQADLGSLRVVQYSTEVMPESTLVRLNRRFPNLRLIQAYGMSELGVLRTRTSDRGSTWLETDATVRVRHGVLEVKSNRAMLGYLNGDNPFTADGWFQTGDLVEEVEGRLRILGRAASSINVGGLKVNPVRVEDVLLGVDGVSDALVTGEDNAILGGLVCARIVAAADQEPERLRRRVIDTCKRRLERHELPRRINFVDALQRTENQKKLRRGI